MHYDFTAIPDAGVPQAVEPIFQHVLQTYASEANKTVSVWRTVPDDLLDFKPHEKANPIRTIMVHQLLSERRFFAQFVGTEEPPVEELLAARRGVRQGNGPQVGLVGHVAPTRSNDHGTGTGVACPCMEGRVFAHTGERLANQGEAASVRSARQGTAHSCGRDVADSLAILLRLWGHEVRVAYDGLAALRAARQFLPHVVLLDFEMPRLNGGEVARRLRDIAEQEVLVAVATTGTALEDIRLAGYDGAFDAYLAKPYNLDLLEQLVADWQHTSLYPTCSAREDRT